jgi:hypothetical protein
MPDFFCEDICMPSTYPDYLGNQLLAPEAGIDGVIAPPDELLPPIEPLAGASDDPIEGVEGIVEVAGGVEVEGEVVEGDEPLVPPVPVPVPLSTFLPQAPNARMADRLTAARAIDLDEIAFIGVSLNKVMKIHKRRDARCAY